MLFWTSNFHFKILRFSYISNVSCSLAIWRIFWLYQTPSQCLWKIDAWFFMHVSFLYGLYNTFFSSFARCCPHNMTITIMTTWQLNTMHTLRCAKNTEITDRFITLITCDRTQTGSSWEIPWSSRLGVGRRADNPALLKLNNCKELSDARQTVLMKGN